jgi:hypothetical protein
MARPNFGAAERGIDQAFAEKRRKSALEAERKEVDAVYKKAVERLAASGSIDPDDFDNYDPMIINEDLKYVEEMEKRFDKDKTPESEQAQKLATVLEAILHDQIELNDWLGPDVMTRKASKYDDYKNGIDSIAEFHQETGVQHLALAMDVTYSVHGNVKLKRIKEDIDRGQLSTVKYFESSDGSFRGSLSQVPRVVIGVDATEIKNLAELWVKRKNKELAVHPVQIKILEEVEMQLRAFQAYAVKIGKQRVADIYARQLRLIESIKGLPEKVELAKKESKSFSETDRVYASIKSGLEEFK